MFAALGLLVLGGPAAYAAAPPVSYTLTGTAGSNGWHRSNVTVKWTVIDDGQLLDTDGCEAADLLTAEGTSTSTCIAHFTWGDVNSAATVKIDKTLPSVPVGTAARAADTNGWYNHAVAVSFAGTDAVSGIDTCSSITGTSGGRAAAGSGRSSAARSAAAASSSRAPEGCER